jgi:hypothetical protein
LPIFIHCPCRTRALACLGSFCLSLDVHLVCVPLGAIQLLTVQLPRRIHHARVFGCSQFADADEEATTLRVENGDDLYCICRSLRVDQRDPAPQTWRTIGRGIGSVQKQSFRQENRLILSEKCRAMRMLDFSCRSEFEA